MTHASLFSGIGGAEIAATWMGWQNLFHCEIQEFPRKVLEYWYPNSISYEDITKTDFTPWRGRIDVLTGASHASLSAVPDSERERMITATSGRKCYARYGRYSPLGSLVRTLLDSSRWYSPARRLTWEAQALCSRRITYTERSSGSPSTKSAMVLSVQDMPSSRLLFRLVPSERPTGATASGLLPMPRSMEIVEDPQNFVKRNGDRKSGCMNNLSSMAAYTPHLLPTPTSTQVRHKGRVEELKAAGGDTFHSRANGETRPNGLTDFLDFNGQLATPTARDWKGAQGRAYKGESMDLPMQVCPPTDGATSQLNPLFVQEMMGFPADWLVLPFLGGERKP